MIAKGANMTQVAVDGSVTEALDLHVFLKFEDDIEIVKENLYDIAKKARRVV